MKFTPKCIIAGKVCGLHKEGHYLKWPCAAKYDPKERKIMFESTKIPCPSCGQLMSPYAQYCVKCNGKMLGDKRRGIGLSLEWRNSMKKAQIERGKIIRENTFLILKQIADEFGGKCLSSTYENSKKNLLWECALGHKFELRSDIVLSKKGWCNECRIQSNKKEGLDRAHLIAKQKHGVCLSKEYKGTHEKLRWECVRGHIWENTLSHVLSGQWCPSCSQFLNESICKNFFEEIFKEKFPKTRPEWLISTKGQKMELDGYSDILKIAFEYQGRQHYEKISYFQQSDESFKERLVNDALKVKLCEEHNIKLFVIPYSVKYEHMYDFITNLASKYDLKISSEKILTDNLIKNHSQRELEEMKNLALRHNGECLSPNYLGSNTKLKWRCENGHIFESSPSNLKQHNLWCPYCSGMRHTIQEMKDVAKSKNGECLSNEYLGSDKKLLWRCEFGHEWEAAPQNILNNKTWCPNCAGNIKLTLPEVILIGKKRGLTLLSKNYSNNNSKIDWQCEKGHIFSLSIINVKERKEPCPVCHPRKLYTIDDMQKIAEDRSGKCLSKEYVSMWTPMEWSCEKNHRWTTKPAYILYKKRWCPFCKKLAVNSNPSR
jgi:hypothetical protein